MNITKVSLLRLISLIVLAVIVQGLMPLYSHAALPASESISYKVKYKWGLVNKHAGNVTINLKQNGSEFNSQLHAASQPWADKFFRLRDTLNGRFRAADLRPSFYEKIANEGSERKHDVVKFSYSGKKATGNCTRKVWKKGSLTVDEARTLSAEGTTVDMLTAYYYMRTLPFQSWQPGYQHTITIFSGKRKELLTIIYHGKETIDTEKHTFDCYHISFIFTSDGKKKTSDDMDAWISTDARRIPVRLEGKLPVGKVQCFYTGS